MQSESGKRTTVMIACTTNETVRVSDPAVYYETDVLHLIYHRGTDARAALYGSLVDEIKRRISEKRDTEIVLHDETVYRYNVMLRTVNDIIRSVRDEYGEFADIFVNISSGTPEYIAAAMCACMMNQGAVPFTVSVKEHTIPPEEYMRMTSVDGRIVGDAKSVNTPKMVETFAIDRPDEDLVRYLSFFSRLGDRPCTPSTLVDLLSSAEVWVYTPSRTSNPGRNSAWVACKRAVIDPLVAKGWLRPGRTKNRWQVTPTGRMVLDVFCDEDDDRDLMEVYETIRVSRENICCCMAAPRDRPDE
ncbi:MAG: hypothetical protein II855_06375 [Candidatus Methanomethylophilaceae archaeon]|nr:hypothetical protein [Candidatus Methanomethylophilaceae archaeon]